MRDEALACLRTFLDSFAQWPDGDRREWANGLMELQDAHPEVHQLIAFPLRTELIAIFEKWAEGDEGAAAPCRWLGSITNDHRWFGQALSRDPNDDRSRLLLAHGLVAETEQSCESLPTSFNGDLAETIGWLNEAEAVLAPIADTASGVVLVGEIANLRRGIDDWVRQQAAGASSDVSH
ncbi:MAG: hypothetical protein AAFO80_06190 [Pseudomonadota bacterium]